MLMRPIALLLALLLVLGPAHVLAAAARGAAPVRLPGHVLPARAEATPVTRAATDTAADPDDHVPPLILTFVLERSDQEGFERYLRDVYDPESPRYRRFLTQRELADRFGPSRDAYETVLGHLRGSGFTLVEGSRNRLTLTVEGTRAAVERTFAVRVGDYRHGDRLFYATDRDPTLPAALAPHVLALSGMSNLARPERATAEDIALVCNVTGAAEGGLFAAAGLAALLGIAPPIGLAAILWFVVHGIAMEIFCMQAQDLLHHLQNSPYDRPAGAPDGTGQVIGLLQFDTFHTSDVRDYIDLVTRAGGTVGSLGNLSQVPVNGGVAAPGPGQTEVLLDVAAAMRIAPGAEVVVYHAPFDGRATSYATLFNAMIDDGVTIISNSWSSCEDQVTLADVQGIDAVLQSAAASGISVFNASGDSGSTCLNGSPNTIGVPAGSPHATAVGGTSLTVGPGATYGGETWWDGSQATPPTGQGGFGVSRFFARPAYQDGLNPSPMRSIPDVAVAADPVGGAVLCQADRGGCPTGLRTGGTSVGAPIWAASTALLNQAQGGNLGALNPLLYPLAGTEAFHDAVSMGTDFAHVGLGSPNLNVLNRLLSGTVAGVPDATASRAETLLLIGLDALYVDFDAGGVPTAIGVPADGTSRNGVLVRLVDAAGNTVGGKTVTLTPDGGSAVVTPPSGVTSVANGSVVFEITDLVAETVTFTVADTTDGVVLADTPSVTFVVPPAASAGISASPSPVNADGVATTTITVTLEDALGRPTPGKLVTLAQGSGHSIISGPDPPVTDADGQIQFTATNLVNETVTYTAVDVADGNLPVPGGTDVTFQNGAAGACGSEPPPVGVNGYALTPFATGFEAGPFFFGGVNFNGCPGAASPAFLDGDVFISNQRTGDLFKLGLDGGAATNALANHGPTLAAETVGADGRLYATRFATTGNFTTGAILEIDPETGTELRTVASNLLCPHSLVVDPLSGDLFYDDFCSGAGSDDPTIHRVRDPASANPTVEVYATLPRTPNGKMAFAPDGTLYAVTGYLDPEPAVVRVSGTDGPMPPTVEPIPGVHSTFWLNVAAVGPGGDAQSLLLFSAMENTLKLVDITTDPPTSTPVAEGVGGGAIGPDGCLYSIRAGHTVFKLTDPTGGCGFLPVAANPSLSLTPPAVSPDPPQGSAQTLTAHLRNVDVPADVPVFFQVRGANPQFKLVRTDAGGDAAFTYVAAKPGTDTIVAVAFVDGSAPTSNRAEITWTAGTHVTSLNLNLSPAGARPGQVIEVVAALTDGSVEPTAPVAGATVTFTLDGADCTATTDAEGIARCALPVGGAGSATLAASFAGTAELTAAASALPFTIGGPAFLGHFTAYAVKTTRGTPKVPKLGALTLGDDTFGLTAGYDVRKLTLLGIPAEKNGEGLGDPVTHLDAYAVKLAKGSPRFQKRIDLIVTNQCGALAVTARKPVTLLVPAARDLESPVPAPEPSDHNVDHLLCYTLKVQKKLGDGTPTAAFPKRVQVDVIDELEGASRRFDLKKPKLLCNPVSKDGAPVILSGKQKGTPVPITPAVVRNPDSHLVCYQAKLARKDVAQSGCGPASPGDKGAKIVPRQAKHTRRQGVHVADQLGTWQVDTRPESLICIPSAVALP